MFLHFMLYSPVVDANLRTAWPNPSFDTCVSALFACLFSALIAKMKYCSVNPGIQ